MIAEQTMNVRPGIVISGNMVLELDDGAERLLKQSDIVVQRGT